MKFLIIVLFLINTLSANIIIPKDIQNNIFNPFYTTKDVGKGTGLGLPISRSIAEAHGGHLSIDNDSPNTRFILRLPLNQSAQQTQH